MKKQNLLLTFFTLALIFAGMNNVFGQDLSSAPTTCLTPTAVTCLTSDALHPIPGTAYDYTVEVPTPPGTKQYTWLVTQDQTFIDATGLVATPESNDGSGAHIQSTGSGYNDPATGGLTLNITWKSFTYDATQPVFVVIYATNEDGNVCTTDNIEVFKIEPVHAFTLDIANLGADGTSQAADYPTCVAPVASAIYNSTTDRVDMDYGVNYLYFIVTAANFTGAWRPEFEVGGAGMVGTRTAAVDWAYPADAASGTWNAMTDDGDGTYSTTGSVQAATPGGTVGATGECIVVRVTVDNNQEETISDAPISLAVDGDMMVESTPGSGNFDTVGTNLYDIHYADCTDDGFDNDVSRQILTPRPDINAVTPTPFIDKDRD